MIKQGPFLYYVQETPLGADHCTDAISIVLGCKVQDESTIQINIVGSASFDIYVQHSADGVNYSGFNNEAGDNVTFLTGQGSGDSPFTYSFSCGKYRYMRVCFENIVGDITYEVWKI